MERARTIVSRRPAVAGLFYPAERALLERQVHALLAGAAPREAERAGALRALIVPHAGYVYSGAVAASAYRMLAPLADTIRRVVLLGPSHRVPLRGLAVPTVQAFETPMGPVALDRAAIEVLVREGLARAWDAPHEEEHALEVQLPFLQSVLRDFALVPVTVGAGDPQAVAGALARVAADPETLVVVSTDLSHFHPYREARIIDGATVDTILRRASTLDGEQACGCHAVNGLLAAARRDDLAVELLDLRNSGDTAGGRDRVVGYASFALHDARA